MSSKLKIVGIGWLGLGLLLLPPSTSSASAQQVEPLSLDLSEVAIETILKTFAQITDSRLEKDPRVAGKVTFRFANVRWETALSAICQSAGCHWQLEEGRNRVLRVQQRDDDEERPESISLRLGYASVREVFQVLVQITGEDLDLDPDIDGQITIHFDSIWIDTALDALCENVGCRWRRQSGTPGKLEIRLAGKDAAAEETPSAAEMLARKISLDLAAADVSEVLRSLAQVLGVDPDLPLELHGDVSLELKDRPISEALDHICEHFFLAWSLARDESESWVLRVRPARGDFGEPRSYRQQPQR